MNSFCNVVIQLRFASSSFIGYELLLCCKLNRQSYFLKILTASLISLESSGSGAYYGTGAYGTATWGQGDLPITRKSVEGSGFAVAIKITDTSTNLPWSIRGFQLEFVPGGRR